MSSTKSRNKPHTDETYSSARRTDDVIKRCGLVDKN